MLRLKYEMRFAAGFLLNQAVKQGCVLSPFILIILMGLCLNAQEMQCETLELNWEEKLVLNLDYADDLSILDESGSKMNEFLEVCKFRVLE